MNVSSSQRHAVNVVLTRSDLLSVSVLRCPGHLSWGRCNRLGWADRWADLRYRVKRLIYLSALTYR